MYFKQVEEIARRLKRCTQRCVKPGETWETDADGNITLVRDQHGRQKWRIGGEYAVSPGRGQPAVLATWNDDGSLFGLMRGVSPASRAAWLNKANTDILRIRITKIERVRLSTMTEDVAVAEGVANLAAYIDLWTSINDGPLVGWDANPLVWRLWFEVVR